MTQDDFRYLAKKKGFYMKDLALRWGMTYQSLNRKLKGRVVPFLFMDALNGLPDMKAIEVNQSEAEIRDKAREERINAGYVSDKASGRPYKF